MATLTITSVASIITGGTISGTFSGFSTGNNNVVIYVQETGGGFTKSGPSGSFTFTDNDAYGMYHLIASDGVNVSTPIEFVVARPAGTPHGTITIESPRGTTATNYNFTAGQAIYVQMTHGVNDVSVIATLSWLNGVIPPTTSYMWTDPAGNGYIGFTMPSQAASGTITVVEDGGYETTLNIAVGGGVAPATLTLNNHSISSGGTVSGTYSGFVAGNKNVIIRVLETGTGITASGPSGSYSFVVTAAGGTYTLSASDGVNTSNSITFTVAATSPGNATLTINTPTVATGGTVTGTFSGFKSGAVTISIAGVGIVGGTYYGPSGNFSFSANISAGTYSMTATDGTSTSPAATLTITNSAVITIANSSIQSGGTVSGTYSGFVTGSNNVVVMVQETGQSVRVSGPSGNYSFSDNSAGGTYTLSATDGANAAPPLTFYITVVSTLHGTVSIEQPKGSTIPVGSYTFSEGSVIFVQMTAGVAGATCTASVAWGGGASTVVNFTSPTVPGKLDLLGNGYATITVPNQVITGVITITENGTVQTALNVSVVAVAPPPPDKYSVGSIVVKLDVLGGSKMPVTTPPSVPVGSQVAVDVLCTNNSTVKEDIRVDVYVYDPNGTPVGDNPYSNTSHGGLLSAGFDVGSQADIENANKFTLSIAGTWTAKIVIFAGAGNITGGASPTDAVYNGDMSISTPLCVVPAITGGIDEPTLSVDSSAAQDLPVTGISSGQSGVIKVVAHNTSGGPITMGLQLQIQGTDGTNLTPAIIKSTVAVKAGAAYTFTSPKFTFDLIGDYTVSANLYSEPDETDTIGTLAAEQLATGVVGPTTGTGVNGANGIMTDIGVKVYAPSLILSIVNFLVSRIVADVGKIAVETIPKDGLAEGNAVRASCVAVNDTSTTPIIFSATFTFTNPDGTKDTQTISSTSPTKLGDSVQLVAPPSGNGWVLSQEGSYLLSISLKANGTEVDTYSGTALTGVKAGVTGIMGDIGSLIGDMMLMMMMGIIMPLMAGSFGGDNNGGGGMFGPPAKPKKPTPPPAPKNEPIYVEQPRYEQLPPYTPPYQQPPPYYPPQQPYQLESYYPQQRYYPPQEPYYPPNYPPPQYYPQQLRYYQLAPPQPQAPPVPEPAPAPQKSGFEKLVDAGTEVAKVAIPAAIAAAPLLLAL